MGGNLQLRELAGAFLGSRIEGRALRMELERVLTESPQVHLNFLGVAITQSCADEFLGVLVAQEGEPLLERLTFLNCRSDVRAILELVIGTRLEDRERLIRAEKTRERLLEHAV